MAPDTKLHPGRFAFALRPSERHASGTSFAFGSGKREFSWLRRAVERPFVRCSGNDSKVAFRPGKLKGDVKPKAVRILSEFRCADHTSSGARGTSSWAETKLGAAMAWPGHCHGTSAPPRSANVAASSLPATISKACVWGGHYLRDSE